MLTIWYVAGGMGAWWLLLHTSPARADARASIDWREAITLAGVSGTTILLGQMERFAAPLRSDEDARVSERAAAEPACAHGRPARISWARLLKRVFEIDLERCPNCGGELKIIAAILKYR
ncbi:MAG: hypothetical protein M3478_07305 [Planctomycetota bacterium]|nr:hypothetical protein [Planctomycetota bacterium]